MAIIFTSEDRGIDTMSKSNDLQLFKFKKDLYQKFIESGSKNYLTFLELCKTDYLATKNSIENTRKDVLNEVCNDDDEQLKKLFNDDELFEIEMIDNDIYNDTFTKENLDEKTLFYQNEYKKNVNHHHNELDNHAKIVITCNGHNIIYSKIEDSVDEVLKYINEEIQKEKTKGAGQLQTDENEPLTTKQVQKIGLLIRSGIIDYLREKNPKIKDNQIAGFISLISDGTMKQESINPNLKKENKNYPIKNQQDKNDLDYILKKYGISPQSE